MDGETKITSSKCESNIIWIDCEMTGLDPNLDVIVEISVLVTDSHLNVVDKGMTFLVKRDQGTLDNMSAWCKETFAKNGLLKDLETALYEIEEIEDKILEYLNQWCFPKTSPLAGNTVYMDRMFLKKGMARLDDFMHYRIIDVSSFKEMCIRWYGKSFAKTYLAHRSLSDILESIEELKFYRDTMMVPVMSNV
uniref:Exonuclease domain-containing protein n=1 Tax=Rhabditophanes sp. KR3021 TaxID=114890 RepID=A0AC35TWB9_9BILA